MITLGALLLLGAMGMGILGLVKRGYELLIVIAMGVLLLLGFACILKGVIS